MTQLLSTKVVIKDYIPVQNMLTIYEIMKNFNGSIYLLDQQRLIRSDHLSRLISFLLTCKSNKEVKMVIKGKDAQKTLALLKSYLTNQHHKNNAPLLTK
ncbi:hypothetical protein NC661_04875 [Aquibacillus koreensis]|uniref:HPr domain-containing protein n=1 Tax=Aquibacillus koreensis TaxID=279446 RepID=A0A9X3WIQ9_9BACI|nr:hypothetical protein [Aquibacillus koreensis]MCT2534692.1 hypothetical protein [Aquibacillus koreensis]MDC3419698.1 hypothetical protein [Aquibacillus koreensis]